jgi:hypothetical protein
MVVVLGLVHDGWGFGGLQAALTNCQIEWSAEDVDPPSP